MPSRIAPSGHSLLKPRQAYALAIVATAVTLAVRLALDSHLGGRPTLVIFMLPIMVSAFAGGWRGGLLATVLSSLAATNYVLPPIRISSSAGRWQQLVMPLAGVVITILTEALQRARRRADTTSRERSELVRQIQADNDRLVAAQAVAKVGSWETDLVTFDVTWSDETHRIFGTTPDTFRPTHAAFLAIIHPDDRAQVDQAFLQSVGQPGVQVIEHRLQMPDGGVKFVEERWQIFAGDQGRPARAVGTCQDISERKHAQERLQRSQSLLRLAERVSRMGAWSIELPAGTLTLSDEARRIYEMPPGFAPTVEEATSFYAPEFKDTIVQAFEACVRDGQPFDTELQIITTTGRRVWVRSIGQAERDHSGGVHRIAGAIHDITDRKLAENALRESHRNFRQLTDNITDAFWIRSADMRHLHYISPAFERIWGRTVESLYANPHEWTDFILPEDRERVQEAFLGLTTDSPQLDIEYRIVRPAGDVRWVRVRGFQVRDGAGTLIRHTGIVTDVTERQHAEAALQDSEGRYRALVQWSPQPIAVSRAGTLLFLNPAAVTMLGAASERELVGTSLLDRVHPDFRELARTRTTGHMEHGGVLPMIEERLIRMDGTFIDVEVQGTSIIFDSEPALFSSIRDVTAANLAQLEISRTARALTMLSGCNDALIRTTDESALLTKVCRIAVAGGGYRMAWVGYRQDDERRSIAPAARAGMEDGFLSEVEATWNENDPLGQGPAGRAIRTGQAVVCPDLALDDQTAPWLEFTAPRGYRGVICLPLRDENQTFGVLTLYAGDVHPTSADELSLLQEIADNLAFGIGNLRAKSDQVRLQTALVKVAVSVSATSGTEFFEQLAHNMADAVGADAAFVARLLPGVPLSARTIAAVIDGEIRDSIDFLVNGTPCEVLFLASDVFVIPADLADRFPDSPFVTAVGGQGFVGRRLTGPSGQLLGILFVVFQSPLNDVEFIMSTLQIFAARAASELERQHTDIQVREQAALLDIAHEAIQVLDLDGRVIYWNKGAEEIYGWTAAEVVGRTAVELFYKGSTGFREALAVLLARGEWQGEVTTHTKAGRDIIVEVRWSLVRDADGKPKSVLAIDTDITDRKRLESQFLRAQRMESIGTLAGGIAHDLNNVLAPILMSVETLSELARTDDDRTLLATLHTSAQRGADLVKQVLSFARGVEGERIVVEPLNLMRDLLKVMSDTFPKSIDVRFTPTPDLWTVTGDPTQMHQILLNLCINARDAMPAGGSLTVSLANVALDEHEGGAAHSPERGAFVRLTVQDTGTGIPLDLRDKIFEPFFTTKEIGKGTGLGLSTTLAIVKSHHGFIRLNSALGTGTTFHVYLPANTSQSATHAVPAEPDRLPHGRGELILVVDDEAGIRAIARRTLERYGYRALLASAGAEAVELYTRHREEIAVVLTDMMMPGMDGPALIVALKAMNPHVRVIGSSGLTSSDGLASAVGGAVEHFLAKPYTADALLKVLRKVLSADRSSRAGVPASKS